MPSFALNLSTTQPLSHFEWPSRSPLEGQVRTGYDGLIESKSPPSAKFSFRTAHSIGGNLTAIGRQTSCT